MTSLKTLVGEVAELRQCLLTNQEHVRQLLSYHRDHLVDKLASAKENASRGNVKVEVRPISRRQISPPSTDSEDSEEDSSEPSEDDSKAILGEDGRAVADLQFALCRTILTNSSGKERRNRLLAAKNFIRRLGRGKEDKPYRKKRVSPVIEDIE